jgi:hypothetical protein
MRAMVKLCRAFTTIAMLDACAMSASAQSVLDAGRSVSVELRDGRRIVGRIVAGDSTTIAIDTGRASVVLDRAFIATVSGRSYRSGVAKALGITGGVVSGLLLGALADAFCGEDNVKADCGGAFLFGAAVGAGAGVAIMGSLGTTIGAAFPRWSDMPTTTPVAHSTFSRLSPAICSSANQWTAEAGQVRPRGYSARVMGTFFCEPGIRSGIELGYLARPFAGFGPYKSSMQTRYAGFVSERSIGHLPFDPHVLGSIQYHNGTERIIETYRDAAGNQLRHDATHPLNGLGFAVAASIGINATPTTSVRLEQRLSFIPSGPTTTFSLSGHWRP